MRCPRPSISKLNHGDERFPGDNSPGAAALAEYWDDDAYNEVLEKEKRDQETLSGLTV